MEGFSVVEDAANSIIQLFSCVVQDYVYFLFYLNTNYLHKVIGKCVIII
jgi:hypothetical protein